MKILTRLDAPHTTQWLLDISGPCGLLQYSMRFLRASPFVSCPNTGVEISCARETPSPRVASFRNWSADWKINQRMFCKSFSFQSLKLGKNKIDRYITNIPRCSIDIMWISFRQPLSLCQLHGEHLLKSWRINSTACDINLYSAYISISRSICTQWCFRFPEKWV